MHGGLALLPGPLHGLEASPWSAGQEEAPVLPLPLPYLPLSQLCLPPTEASWGQDHFPSLPPCPRAQCHLPKGTSSCFLDLPAPVPTGQNPPQGEGLTTLCDMGRIRDIRDDRLVSGLSDGFPCLLPPGARTSLSGPCHFVACFPASFFLKMNLVVPGPLPFHGNHQVSRTY